MATFVLVHGAWGGSYGFGATRRLLQAQGHEVFTPSLTGIGERVHLSSAQVNLTTHITDVVNSVLYEDLRDIVLLGFSYGGFVVAGALDHIAPRVAQLVFLDAFVPNDGDTVNAVTGWSPPGIGPGVDWALPPLPREYEDAAAGVFSEVRRVPHPIGCFSEPVKLSQPIEAFDMPLTYIKATGEPRDEGPFWEAGDRARGSSAWTYHEIDCNHMIPSNRPGELAELLAGLVS